jgi:hypothetical protein
MTSMSNLANVIGDQGKYEQAEEMHRHVPRHVSCKCERNVGRILGYEYSSGWPQSVWRGQVPAKAWESAFLNLRSFCPISSLKESCSEISTLGWTDVMRP